MEHSLKVLDLKGKKKGELKVHADALGSKVRKRLLKEVILMQERNLRQGSANTKSRGQVRASSSKPWRQKGTGRARAGDRNSNIWRGGSIAHGPKPRDFRRTIPSKIRRQALASAVLAKIIDQEVIVVEDLNFSQVKTQLAHKALKALKIEKSVVVANHEYNKGSLLSFRNLAQAQTMQATDLNALSVIKHRHLLITKQGLEDLIKRVAVGSQQEAQV